MADAFPGRAAIAAGQLTRLRAVLREALPANAFYARKLAGTGVTAAVASLEEFRRRAPFTTKAEVAADQQAHPPYGSALTYPLERYVRCHQTSGTIGHPLRWLDTAESWGWMLDNWETVHRVSGVNHADRIFFAFSFGPFLGFWTAFESALRLGCLVLPGGGMSSAARLRNILDQRATVLCCTPTYAIRLAEVAAAEKLDLHRSALRILSVAGEPGGSIPAIRRRLEELWPGARVNDHHGMTEVGPVSFECPARPGVLHVMEHAYVTEVIDPGTLQPVPAGASGELVLTPLGRAGSPLLRYRTGDLVRPEFFGERPCACGRYDVALAGGILGRVDDMVVVRGVNIYPSALDEIIRGAGGVAEYRVRVSTAGSLAELAVEVEPAADCADAAGLAVGLEKAFANAFTLRVPVTLVEPGRLPRFEMKAKRWVKED
jgi:phenylacetate-CoA ligase